MCFGSHWHIILYYLWHTFHSWTICVGLHSWSRPELINSSLQFIRNRANDSLDKMRWWYCWECINTVCRYLIVTVQKLKGWGRKRCPILWEKWISSFEWTSASENRLHNSPLSVNDPDRCLLQFGTQNLNITQLWTAFIRREVHIKKYRIK